jgi:hypothetical protein
VDDPATGRFLQTDPVPGGSANNYDYCNGDPVNCYDLAGTWPGWVKSIFNGVVATARAAANVLNGSTYAGMRYAMAMGGRCATAKGGMILCTGMAKGSVSFAHAFTIGNVTMTEDNGLLKGELAHETKHADQWAALGWGMVPAYFTAMGISESVALAFHEGPGHGQCANPFEWSAGFAGGQYSKC